MEINKLVSFYEAQLIKHWFLWFWLFLYRTITWADALFTLGVLFISYLLNLLLLHLLLRAVTSLFTVNFSKIRGFIGPIA